MKRRSILAMGTLALVAIGVLGLAACGKKASQTEEEVKGLVIHYDMSMSDKRTLTDVSGNGNDGEVFVASGFSVEDGVGFLDGTAIGLPSEVFTGEDEISISIWTKDYSGATNTSLIYLGADTSSIESYYLLNPSNPSGRLKSVFTNSVNTDAPYNTEVGVSPTIASNGVQGPMVGLEWNHFVVVFSGTTMTTYMNGEKIADTELSKSLSDFGDIKAYLGRSAYTDDPLYVGFIQDVKIYNEAITQETVAELYNEHSDLKETNATSSEVLISDRADPYITLGSDGYYYFTASYPMYGSNDSEGYDRVILRRATTIEGLADAEEITIWNQADSDDTFKYIWAPEIHEINGVWYVFYTGSVESSNVWAIRPHVLRCTGDDPYTDEWENLGVMVPMEGDTFSFTGFSLDMTYFEVDGRGYVIWAQTSGNSNLYIASVDPNQPWILTSKPMLLTQPEYYWEEVLIPVNEGPAVLIHDGKVFVTFSASATGPEYCVGLIYADATADLLDSSSWTKLAEPLLTSEDLVDEYGPGHNSFTVDSEGNYVFVYHSRTKECYEGECGYSSYDSLYDPCRSAHVRYVEWDEDGLPVLNCGDYLEGK